MKVRELAAGLHDKMAFRELILPDRVCRGFARSLCSITEAVPGCVVSIHHSKVESSGVKYCTCLAHLKTLWAYIVRKNCSLVGWQPGWFLGWPGRGWISLCSGDMSLGEVLRLSRCLVHSVYHTPTSGTIPELVHGRTIV